MKRILIYSYSDLRRDPRVSRQIDCLSDSYEIIPVGLNPPVDRYPGAIDLSAYPAPKVHGASLGGKLGNLFKENPALDILGILLVGLCKRLPIPAHARYGLQRFFFERRIIRKLAGTDFDLVLGNDITALRICALAKKGRPFVYDAHEYTPGQFGTGKAEEDRAEDATKLLRRYLPQANAMMTVCEGIASKYAETFGVKKPEVVTNASGYCALSPIECEDGKIKLVHHGHAARSRMLEEMIDAVGLLDSRFELHFFLVCHDEAYLRGLVDRAAASGRVFFHEPVPMADLPRELNRYDVGLYILPPSNYNQLHALPNKLFEFVQARLAVAIGPSPEMAAIVRDNGLGVVAGEFSAAAMAAELSVLDKSKVMEFKQNAHRHAMELSAGPQMEKLRKIIEMTLKASEMAVKA